MSKRNYKDEYEKFQKDKSGYRAKLNKYNRKKGTYGNGDGKDASHKNGKIVGFVDSSKNKGKKEKSRMKGSVRKAQAGGKVSNKSVKGRKLKSYSEEMKIFAKNATRRQIERYIKYYGPGSEFGPLSDKEVKRQTEKWFNLNKKGSSKETEKKVQKSHGGKMIGPSHKDGGINIEVEGEEIVINKSKNNAAGIHEKELLALNNNPDDYVIVNKNEYNWPSSDARKRGE